MHRINTQSILKPEISNIEILREMSAAGTLRPLVTAGLIPTKVLTYMEMFYDVDRQVKAGECKRQAVCMTATVFKVTPQCVYRAIKTLR